MKETSSQGLQFHRTDVSTARVLVFSDAQFTNEPGIRSQKYFVVFMLGEEQNDDIVHFDS